MFDGRSQHTPGGFGSGAYHNVNRDKDNGSKLNTDLLAVSMIGVPTHPQPRKHTQQNGIQNHIKTPVLKYLVEDKLQTPGVSMLANNQMDLIIDRELTLDDVPPMFMGGR